MGATKTSIIIDYFDQGPAARKQCWRVDSQLLSFYYTEFETFQRKIYIEIVIIRGFLPSNLI